MGKLGLGDILTDFFNDIEKASKKAKKEIDNLSISFSENLSKIEGFSQKKATKVLELLQNSDSFNAMVKKLNERKDASSSVIIAAATFPNGKFLTSRAIAERFEELGFNPIRTMFLHQIISKFKRSRNRGKEMIESLIDAKNVTSSHKRRVRHVVCLNYMGRKSAGFISRQMGCALLVRRILGSGIDNSTLTRSIDNLELSGRANNVLKMAKIETIGELISKKEENLRKLKNSNEEVIVSIIRALSHYNLSLTL
ncbi:MAG: hypothetical protein COU40_03145 [Candidatus Moranbacteria bacterium CG10_big_fil_rev_8_21_14_0_10_35_21]|nr:MAG: hypothetical protein COU40_03145 [Candidatus Moranbacteria bacterium CG10_big_fil_rev_8_21_14_0_10_35_21]PJA88528.1 MAG: hypothetical protein CO139_02700 [Candidatus Moranbacteria bacterium CG_4_9_14_3_um_filter_36_9]